MRCTEKKPDGKRCRVYALVGEKLCLFHSDSEAAKQAREKRKVKRILSNPELILLLQAELRKVKKSKNDEYRSGETRRIIELISELKGERPPVGNGKKSLTFKERVERANQRKKNKK